MLAYRNPSNEDSDSIFNYTLKLDAYVLLMASNTLILPKMVALFHSLDK